MRGQRQLPGFCPWHDHEDFIPQVNYFRWDDIKSSRKLKSSRS